MSEKNANVTTIVEWMDMLKPHGTHPSGVRAVRLTHFVPAGDVLAYGQQPYGATFWGGYLHRGSVLCTPPPA